ncbi:MAG: encapsulin [Chromatiales bacterium]
MNPGQERLSWSQPLWDRLNKAVHDETQRIRVASKFLPLHGPVEVGTLTVPSDTIVIAAQQPLMVNEAICEPLIEIWVEFLLTAQQVAREDELMTAITLATRATNLLSQAEDALLLLGQSAIAGRRAGPGGQPPAIPQNPLFVNNQVRWRSGPAGTGLLGWNLPATQVVPVPIDNPGPPVRYGENTFGAVEDAYARLQGNGHYGPYALVLPTRAYADAHAPLANTLIMPADRIRPLVTHGEMTHFYGTGTLPEDSGVMVSLGGNSMDLVVGMDATAAFMQDDTEGRCRFRVFERFALRLKDNTAVIRLNFEQRQP